MATEIASAYVSLVPSFRGGGRAISNSLAGPISKAGPVAGRSLGRSILGGVTKAAAAGGGIAAALGLARLGKDAIAAASGLQNTTATLTGLLGSAKAAQETMTALRDVSRKSPISYQAYLEAAEAMAYMGYQGEEAAGILENVGAAVTAAGGDDEAIGRATNAMLQMVNSGKVYAAQLNQISQTGVPIFSALADHFNTNIANVREMVTAGEVGINDVMAAIKNASGDTFQSMLAASEGASKTLSNQWRIAKDNIVVALADQLLPVINSLTPAMEKFGAVAPDIIASIATKIIGGLITAARAVVRFGSAAVDMAKSIKPYWDALFGRGDEYSSSPIIRGLLRVNELAQSVRRELNIMPRRVWFGEIRNSVLESLERTQGLVVDIRREVNTFPRTNEFARLMDRVEAIKTETLARFSSIWDSLKRTFMGLAPSVVRIGEAVGVLVPALAKASAEVGVSAWSIFLAVLDSLAKITAAVLVPAMDMLSRALRSAAEWLSQNEGAARALVLVYTGWKIKALVTAVFGLVSALAAKAGALWASTAAFVANTKASIANAAAKVRNIALTTAIVGLYVRDAAAKAASTAATVASTAATKALTVAQKALNLVLRANPIGIVITVLGLLAAAIVTAWKRSETFRNIVLAVWGAIQKAIQFAWNSIIKPVVDAFVRGLQWIGETTQRVVADLRRRWDSLRRILSAAWSAIKKTAIDPFVRGLQSIWDKAIAVKDGIVNAWKKVAGAIGKAFENVTDGIRSALDKVFGFIDRWLIRPINKVLDVFNVKPIPELSGSRGGGKGGRSLPKYHSGGHVPGRSEHPAMLLGGEAVLNRDAVSVLGKDTIDALNSGKFKHRPGENDPRAMGGWGDIAGAVWNGLKALDPRYDAAEKILKKGAEASIKGIVDPALKKIKANLSGSRVVTGPAYGTAKTIRDEVMEWAKATDKKAGVELGEGTLVGGTPSFRGKFAFPLPRGSYRVGGGIGSYPGHTGRDFPAPVGTPVFSPMDGRVQFVRMAGSYGLHANVYAGALRFIAAHLSSFVGRDRLVKAGEMIGRVGSTGNSTGPHLHAEFRRNGVVVNPDQYIGMDTGIGVLKPGHNLVYNGTGANEPIVDPRRFDTAGRKIEVHTYGTPRQLVSDVVFAIDAHDRSRQKVMV